MEVRIPQSRSLKAKRSVVRHLTETARRRYGVAASETDHHDAWQRAELGFAAVGPDASHVASLLDTVERFVWSHPEVEVIRCDRRWMAEDA